MADPGEEGVAGALARQLAEEAEHVGEGALVIDADLALDKLGRYQLSDPYHYVLRLAEAGMRLGAAGLWFWTGTQTLVAHIDGGEADLSLPPETLENLLVVLVGEHSAEHAPWEALVQLAVAVNAARVQLEPEQLWLDSVGPGGRGHRLMLEGEQPRLVAIDGGEPGIWLRLRERPSNLVERVAGSLVGARPEARLLRERAVWAATPIALDNRRISFGFSLRGGAPIYADDGQAIGVGVITRRDAKAKACLVLCAMGIEVERVYPEGARPGYFALVEARLPRDLGYARFARGPEFDALVSRAISVESAAASLTPQRGSVQNLALTRRGKAILVGSAGFQGAAMLLLFYGLAVMNEALSSVAGMLALMIAPIVLLLGTIFSSANAEVIAPTPKRLGESERRAPRLALAAAEAPRALPPAS